MKKLLLVLAFIPAILFSQSRKERKALEAQQKADQVVINNLKSHLQNLTVNTSTSQSKDLSEAKAIEYISNQFKLIGLQPKGSNGFIQSYNIDDGRKIDPTTYLKVNDKFAEVNTEYFPLSYSAEKKVKGRPVMALRERSVPWFVDIKDWIEDGSTIMGNNIDAVIKKETAKVASKGATALFLYNSGMAADGLFFNSKDKTTPSPIPVIYVTALGLKKYFHDNSEVLDIELNVAFKESSLSGNNVAGYIDNAAISTTVVGAYYKYNLSDGDAKIEVIQKSISRGADENGSGVAMLIELARMLSVSKAKNNNYVFIAFGGSDKGLTAGNYWLNNTGNIASLNYLVNLDMAGSYGDTKKLMVQGYNSSPIWNDVFKTVADRKVDISIDSGGIGNDATASFYKKGIPELSFSFTTHGDYMPSADEVGKINYAGILQITKFINHLVEITDAKGKVAFTKIPQNNLAANIAAQAVIKSEKTDETTTAATKATVSLGVIPEKANNETGLKISGVTPKKIASKLGLQPGDVITNLGAYKISDLKSYMDALSNFKTGDKTILRIKRGKDDKEFAVEF